MPLMLPRTPQYKPTFRRQANSGVQLSAAHLPKHFKDVLCILKVLVSFQPADRQRMVRPPQKGKEPLSSLWQEGRQAGAGLPRQRLLKGVRCSAKRLKAPSGKRDARRGQVFSAQDSAC